MLPSSSAEVPLLLNQELSFPWTACQLYQVALIIMTEIYTWFTKRSILEYSYPILSFLFIEQVLTISQKCPFTTA
jgi:hypothetical protein